MRSPRRRLALAALLLAGGALLIGPAPGPAYAQQAEPGITYEAWFFRAKPRSPQVETPAGPVSPGPGVPPAPQAPDGAYVVSFAGGQPGDSETGGDTGWAAFQWDLFEAAGGTVEEFIVTLTQAPDNRGDVNAETAPIQACNIVASWAGVPSANPWEERPTIDCASAVTPTVEEREGRLTFTFDLTEMAGTWAEGDGHGVAIRPGGPDVAGPLPPFQLTFAGYGTLADEAEQVRPRVRFSYSGGLDEAGGLDDGGFDDGGFDRGSLDDGSFDGGSVGGTAGGFDDGSFAGASGGFDDGSLGGGFDGGQLAQPGLDVNIDDVGSAPGAEPPPGAGGDELAAPPTPTQRVSTSAGFPLAGWLLVPLALVAFVGTGTALGPAGDPVAPRSGGVSRALGERRATRSSTGVSSHGAPGTAAPDTTTRENSEL